MLPQGDGMMRLPWHWSFKNLSIDQLQIHCDFHPDFARQTDSQGHVPLHYAATYSTDPGVVKWLLDAYPEAVFMESHFEIYFDFQNQYPIEKFELAA